MDLNKFYADYCKDPQKAKFEMAQKAARDYKFEYMLLNRLQCDCNYYLDHGGRNAQHCLWTHDEQKTNR